MKRIDATLANAGSQVRLTRATACTRPDVEEMLALLARCRGDGAREPVHALVWCHDGLFGGCATPDGFQLATWRNVPFSIGDALEIRLFAPGFELRGVQELKRGTKAAGRLSADSTAPREAGQGDTHIQWVLHREADDAGWVPAPPALYPVDQRTAGDSAEFRCLTEFHHVFGTTWAQVRASVSIDTTTGCATGAKAGGTPRLWRLTEANRGIHWHLAAAAIGTKTYDTRRVRHAWGHGANLFLAVRQYLHAAPEDGSLSTLSVCLGGFWRLSADERYLEEVQPG